MTAASNLLHVQCLDGLLNLDRTPSHGHSQDGIQMTSSVKPGLCSPAPFIHTDKRARHRRVIRHSARGFRVAGQPQAVVHRLFQCAGRQARLYPPKTSIPAASHLYRRIDLNWLHHHGWPCRSGGKVPNSRLPAFWARHALTIILAQV